MLHEALITQQRKIWADWEDLPATPEWTEMVHRGIEEADVLIFVLSRNSLRNPECGWDLDHALKHGKRIVPVVPPYESEQRTHLDKALRGTPFAAELAFMRWVFFNKPSARFGASSSSSSSSSSLSFAFLDHDLDEKHESLPLLPAASAASSSTATFNDWNFDNDDFKLSMNLLLREVDGETEKDRQYLRLHTELLKAALEWERRDFDKSLLLGAGMNPWRSGELRRAQDWLARASLGQSPRPTALHVAFIDNSMQVVTGLQLRQVIAAFSAIIIGVGIAFPGWGVFFFMLIFLHSFVLISSSG